MNFSQSNEPQNGSKFHMYGDLCAKKQIFSTEIDVRRGKYTAGEDQLPQESANVTRGSDHSSPHVLLPIISLFFVDFGHDCYSKTS